MKKSTQKRSKKKFRFAIVGCGQTGLKFYQYLEKESQRLSLSVPVIVEPDSNRVRALKGSVKKSTLFLSQLDEIAQLPAATRPDGVIIAVPKHIHVEVTMRALSLGLHCLVEQPLAFSAADCESLKAKAREKKKHLQVILPDRWLLGQLWNKWQIPKAPVFINTMRTGPFIPRAADTNVIFESLLQDIDLFVLLNEVFSFAPIKKIQSSGRKSRSRFLDYANIDFELEDGSQIRFFASRLSTKARRSWELSGQNYHASIDFMRKSMKRFQKNSKGIWDAEQTQATRDPLSLELMSFLSSIKNGSFKGKPDLKNLSTLGVRWVSMMKTHELTDQIISKIKVFDP